MARSDAAENPLTAEQGQVLVEFARQSISARLGCQVPRGEIETVAAQLEAEVFQTRRGTFVTLTQKGQLRGCIGSIQPVDTIAEGVRRNAVNAAFYDPRFSPLTPEELPATHIEVSILTDPQPLEYTDAEDLLKKLRVNVDGVIIRQGAASATFLPQVWDQLPRPQDFLTHLCRKARLSPSAWRASRLEVLIYQVQYFEETR